MARSAVTPRFGGFPPEAIELYRGLEADNSKAFWEAHKATYDAAVRGPFEALAAELEGELGTFHLFRPHRDVRFSKDKSPYKTHQGAVTEGEGGEMYYVQLSTEGLFVASGYYRMAKDQLDRYRRAVVADETGAELVGIVAELERRYEIGGRELKTAPRGYPRDHERVRFLQHKGITAGRRFGAPTWLSTREALRRIRNSWRGAEPLHAWLNAHVGPSELAPDDAWG